MGLVFRHLPNTKYGRGTSQRNELEARAVVESVLDHVIKHPELSLGIVAFSKAQEEVIEDELDRVRKIEPALQSFDERHGLDRLFVKNLESVQGDERDVIYISIGYGRDENGFLAMNFGPVSREGGHRRLNVLITRARVRTVVFCNFKSSDMRMGESRMEGVNALHTFLAFAESGHLDAMPAVLKMEPSYFEELVFEQLRNRGYEVDKQVGSEGFYIDLAVRHPLAPGKYVVGIECDGAMYHSAKTARDRDRLRQQVLEDRGWNIHRIWSTDWWRHADRELERCIQSIEACANAFASPSNVAVHILQTPEAIDISERVFLEPSGTPARSAKEPISSSRGNQYFTANLYWQHGDEILEVPPWKLAAFVKEVVEVEAPVHVDEVIRRIREAAGKGRAGNKIRDHVLASIGAASRHGLVETRGQFVYKLNQTEFNVRSRADFSQQVKRIEFVAPEEIEVAAIQILEEAVAIEFADVARPVAIMLGFDRVTTDMSAHIETVLRASISSGRLELSMDRLRLAQYLQR